MSRVSDVFDTVTSDMYSGIKYATSHINDSFDSVVSGISNTADSVVSSINNLRSRKSVTIDNKYASGNGKWKAFTTAKKAKQFRADYGMDQFDETPGQVEMIIPENISQMTITWFVNVMYPSYYKLGDEAFKKYKWKIIKNDEAPDRVRVLQDQLHMGFEHCKELKERGFNPENWDESVSTSNKYSFETVTFGELVSGFFKEFGKNVQQKFNSVAQSTAWFLNRNIVWYQVVMNISAFIIPVGFALAFPGTYMGLISAVCAVILLYAVELSRSAYS